MAYLILADRNGEFDRRELRAGESLVIGRALECDVCIRDILLSRKHCRIEPFDAAAPAGEARWLVTDLQSKNGTFVGGSEEAVTRHALIDGEVIRIGKSQICFHASPFVPPAPGQHQRRDVRPADPNEAMQGTVCGFQLFDMEEDSKAASGFPIPQPRPAEPRSYRNGDSVHAMVLELTSTAWDTVLSEPEFCPPTTLKVMTAPTKTRKPPKEIVARENYIRKAKAVDETVPAAKIHRLPSIRSASPDRSGKIPTWVAATYIVLAACVGATSLGILLIRGTF
jgi:pSer/pThr/pTyr-binding forkhead associated (FHA) protein